MSFNDIFASTATYAAAVANKVDGEILYAGLAADASGSPYNQALYNLRQINAAFNGEATVSALVVEALTVAGMELPAEDGAAGQVLTTDGDGTLTWETPSGGGGSGDIESVGVGGDLTGGGLSGAVTITLPDTLTRKTLRGLTVAPDAATGAVTSPLVVTTPAHTALTASTAKPWVSVAAQTWQWATGSIDDQHFIEFLAPTMAFVGASVVGRATTIYAAAPLAGTNATLTTSAAAVLCAPTAGSYALICDKDVAAGANKYISFTRQDVEKVRIELDASDVLQITGPAGAGIYSTSGYVRALEATGVKAQYNNGPFLLINTAAISLNSQTVLDKFGYGGAPTAFHHFITYSQTSGAVPMFQYDSAAANTNRTASTEVPEVDWNIAQTFEWATGALTTQRFFRVRQPTVAFVGASTLTDAYTVYIDGPPDQGDNATITNPWALGIGTGAVNISTGATGGGLLGLRLNNPTVADNTTRSQAPPHYLMHGSGKHATIVRQQYWALLVDPKGTASTDQPTSITSGWFGIGFSDDNASWNYPIRLGQSAIGFYGANPAAQAGGVGATLTNSVTSGGTDNTIDDWTSLTVYATDAAAIRNAVYQLARKLRLLELAVKAPGLAVT